MLCVRLREGACRPTGYVVGWERWSDAMMRRRQRHVRCHMRRTSMLGRRVVVARLMEVRRKRGCARRWWSLVELLVLPRGRRRLRAWVGTVGRHGVAFVGWHAHHAGRRRTVGTGWTHAGARVAVRHGRRRGWAMVMHARVAAGRIRRARSVGCERRKRDERRKRRVNRRVSECACDTRTSRRDRAGDRSGAAGDGCATEKPSQIG